VYQWFAELQLFQGKDQQAKSEKTLRAYNYRLGFFLDFTAQQNLRYLDQLDRKQLLRYVKFLRDHESDLDDRTVHNVFETLNPFLRTRDIFIAGKILAELDYAEKPPKPYTKQELKDMFAAMDEEEKLLYGLFLNSGVRDAEMQNTEYADFNWEKCTLHVQPKPWRHFRLKGKKKKKSAKDRFIPIPAKLVWKIKGQNARAECAAARPRVSKRKREARWALPAEAEDDCEKDRRRRRGASSLPQDVCRHSA
jgi:integrase